MTIRPPGVSLPSDGGAEAALRLATLPPKRKVRLHPLPRGANRELADVLARAVAGAVRDALNQQCPGMSAQEIGMLVGSIRKRAVNDLVSREGEAAIRAALVEPRK